MTDRIDQELAEKIDARFGLEPTRPSFSVKDIIKDCCGYATEFLVGIAVPVLAFFGVELL